MCSLINKQLLLTAYAYLFIMEQQNGQRGSEALQLETQKSSATCTIGHLKEAINSKKCPKDVRDALLGGGRLQLPGGDTQQVTRTDVEKNFLKSVSDSAKKFLDDVFNSRRAPSSLVQPDNAALLFEQFRENASFRNFVTGKNIELAGQLGKPGEPEAKLKQSDAKKLANLAKEWLRQGTLPTIAEEFEDELRTVLLSQKEKETEKNWDIRVTELLNTWRTEGVTIPQVHDHVEKKSNWFQTTNIEEALKLAIVAALGNMEKTAKYRELEAQKKAAEQAKQAAKRAAPNAQVGGALSKIIEEALLS